MQSIVLGTGSIARNKSKYLFSQSFHSYVGQTYSTGLYQYHAPNQYFPKGGIHTTNKIWNYVGMHRLIQ